MSGDLNGHNAITAMLWRELRFECLMLGVWLLIDAAKSNVYWINCIREWRFVCVDQPWRTNNESIENNDIQTLPYGAYYAGWMGLYPASTSSSANSSLQYVVFPIGHLLLHTNSTYMRWCNTFRTTQTRPPPNFVVESSPYHCVPCSRDTWIHEKYFKYVLPFIFCYIRCALSS